MRPAVQSSVHRLSESGSLLFLICVALPAVAFVAYLAVDGIRNIRLRRRHRRHRDQTV